MYTKCSELAVRISASEKDLPVFHSNIILGSWFYLVFFCGAIKLTGPFVVMIYAMIMGDMYTFSIIYIIFLFGFTQAFFYLIKSTEVSFRFTDLLHSGMVEGLKIWRAVE